VYEPPHSSSEASLTAGPVPIERPKKSTRFGFQCNPASCSMRDSVRCSVSCSVSCNLRCRASCRASCSASCSASWHPFQIAVQPCEWQRALQCELQCGLQCELQCELQCALQCELQCNLQRELAPVSDCSAALRVAACVAV